MQAKWMAGKDDLILCMETAVYNTAFTMLSKHAQNLCITKDNGMLMVGFCRY